MDLSLQVEIPFIAMFQRMLPRAFLALTNVSIHFQTVFAVTIVYYFILRNLYNILCRFTIWEKTKQITDNIAFFLPRNANIEQVNNSHSLIIIITAILTFTTEINQWYGRLLPNSIR